MSWPVCLDRERITLRTGRVPDADAARQLRTAEEILARLGRQPGVILADEVGMGKTFVALSVAVSAAWAARGQDPVVVMVPPSLREKWPTDFQVFRETCLLRDADRHLRAELATTGVEFLKLLDDPPDRRCNLIFMVHGAVHRGLTDPWTKLYILKEALRSPRLRKQRSIFHRFARQIVRHGHGEPDMYHALLESPPQRWRRILTRFLEDPGDDPVPEAVTNALGARNIDLAELRGALERMPVKKSVRLEERIVAVRRTLNAILQEIWRECLLQSRFESPLLVLDEAHHLKNPSTRLASLFVDPEAEEDLSLLQGALSGRFERMLFLTATPFQLGHGELLNVLGRFRGIRWPREGMTPECFDRSIDELRIALDRANQASAHLDEKWRRLDAAALRLSSEEDSPLDAWWRDVRGAMDGQADIVQEVIRTYDRALQAMRDAEQHLQPWVIRHARPTHLPDSDTPRRMVLPGAAICPGRETDREGLEIERAAILPFLLAARSQAILERKARERGRSTAATATFAEGLASSYEAFLRTRAGRTPDDLDEVPSVGNGDISHADLPWYLGHLARSLPDESSHGRHPKIESTVARALDLWKRREKVLIFCHWRATGAALERHLSGALNDLLAKEAARRLGCDARELDAVLERFGDRFDPDRPMFRHLREVVDEELRRTGLARHEERGRILDVVRRFARTPSFLLRYFPVEAPESVGAFDDALRRADDSGISLLLKIRRLVEFLSERTPAEREEYLLALDKIQTGLRYRRATEGDVASAGLLPNIRLVNGAVKPEDRRHVLLAFNTPFFPDILIASSVLAEGVDLHLDCRFVIHHDLSWNPSTLEQRTGRVDRLGGKADRSGRSIEVFLPFLAGTQDEKMYRVVRDRERWFQVLMGEKYEVEKGVGTPETNRLPLPEAAARELAFRLHLDEQEDN